MDLTPRQMFSLRLRNFLTTRYGERVEDKIRLFVWALLDLYPRTAPIFSSYLMRFIRPKQNGLSRKITINKYGNRFCLQDSWNINILSSEFEPFVKKHLILQKGDVFVDVGANIGLYSMQAAKIVGSKGLVVAIEPDPENFAALKKNIALNNLENVRAFNLAAWCQKVRLNLFLGEYTSQHDSAKIDWGFGHVVVQAVTLDEILQSLNIGRVDFVKVDVEGAELEVLRGLNETMKKHKPSIIVEIWESDRSRVERIGTFLKQMLYEMEKIGPDYYLLSPAK